MGLDAKTGTYVFDDGPNFWAVGEMYARLREGLEEGNGVQESETDTQQVKKDSKDCAVPALRHVNVH